MLLSPPAVVTRTSCGHRSSVRRELGWLSALLPLFFVDTWRTWSDQLHAGDASDSGFGVCSHASSSEIAAGLGRVSERWRFKAEDAIAARKHALRSIAFAVDRHRIDPVSCAPLDPIPAMPPPVSESQMRAEFEEVLLSCARTPAGTSFFGEMERPSQHSSRGRQGCRHVCKARPPKPLRPRQAPYTILCDNLPLTLALAKGRANSFHLLQSCREICALSLFSSSEFHFR